MKLGPFEISLRQKAPVGPTLMPPGFSSGNSMGFWPTVRESFTGAWQRNIEVRRDLVLAYWAVYSCTTLIAGDIGKLCAKLMEELDAGNSVETTSPAFSPVLNRPNAYQTWQQFIEYWVISKLSHGNAYIFLVRDNRQVVVEMHVLNPFRVCPLVAPLDGAVFYQLQQDYLAGIDPETATAIPASEIIHDRMNCLFHPLMGVPPIYACGLAATQGLKIQENSAKFFANMSRPSGVLTAPKNISDDTAARLKTHWENNYNDGNLGKIAVLGDGLKYEPMTMSAEEAQMVAQLELTAMIVCSTFHVPPYMIDVGPAPPYNNIEAINQQYYNKALQVHIEAIENGLNYGLGLGKPRDAGGPLCVELDLDGLLRMDSATQGKTLGDLVGAGIAAPNEARLKLNMKPITGGDTPYLQQQNYSLAALDKRDASADPFGTAKPPAAPPIPPAPPADAPPADAAAKSIADGLMSMRALIESAEAAERSRVEREAEAAKKRSEDEERIRQEVDLLSQREASMAERETLMKVEAERVRVEHEEQLRAGQEAIEARVSAQIEAERIQLQLETKAREDESTEDFAAMLIAKFSALGDAD